MGQDDLSNTDSLQGKTDLASQVTRFTNVNNILQRAISRLQVILTDLGSSGPSGDPSVQSVIQQICASAAAPAGVAIPSSGGTVTNPIDGIIVKVVRDPGPIGTPDVTSTLNFINQTGQTLQQLSSGGTVTSGSSIEVKKDVSYLGDAERAAIAEETLGLRLAQFKYKTGDDRTRLGFMLEDSPDVPAADMKSKQVDLYAYTSMVVATVQQQQAEIAALKAEIERLKNK